LDQNGNRSKPYLLPRSNNRSGKENEGSHETKSKREKIEAVEKDTDQTGTDRLEHGMGSRSLHLGYAGSSCCPGSEEAKLTKPSR
jgi:hypothetical protein